MVKSSGCNDSVGKRYLPSLPQLDREVDDRAVEGQTRECGEDPLKPFMFFGTRFVISQDLNFGDDGNGERARLKEMVQVRVVFV